MSSKIHKEILKEAISEAESGEAGKGRNPIFYISALFIIILLVLWALPLSTVKLDPEPRNMPLLNDILPDILSMPNISRPNGTNIRSFVDPINHVVKRAATKIVTQSCEPSKDAYKVCQAKAVFYFVRDNFAYVSETDEYIQTPEEMFYSRGGDCDDFAVLLASMEQAIGTPTRFVQMPRHVYVQVYVQDAHKKYKQEDGWINLDATCKSCGFGSVAVKYKNLPKRYIW